MKLGKIAIGASLTLLVTVSSFANTLKTSCYLLDQKGQAIQGVRTEKRYEIASVSKIMTSYWAAAVRSLSYRYQTKIHVAPVDKNLADVHIEGSADPFFNREQLQYVIAQLNELGVKKIRTLSFDENFKYRDSSRDSRTAGGHYDLTYPSSEAVEAQLKVFLTRINGLYLATRQRAKKMVGLELPPELTLKVGEVLPRTRESFASDGGFNDPSVRHLISRSVPLELMLKEMNRSSNNYAANILFESLGGAEEFKKFIKKKLGLVESQIRFLNGSGDRFDYADGKFAYNEATCQAVIALIGALKAEVEVQKRKLSDVLAVAGMDPVGEESTVGIYSNESTSGALIAKTGTVDPAISLAGMASTAEGDIYFGYIYGTNGSRSDQRNARGSIQKDLVKLYKKFGNKDVIDYQAKKFIAFDKVSALREDSLANTLKVENP